MSRFPDILNCGFASGVARYDDRYPGQEQFARIVVVIGTDTFPNIQAIVDTGAPWCILDPEIASLGAAAELDEDADLIRLGIRGEIYEGRLVRAQIILYAEEGDTLEVETTIFVPKLENGTSWRHPNFIGLGNFLDRICFAVDPHPDENAFYFGNVG